MSLRATRVEIDIQAFISNLKILQNKINNRKLCLAVKANAYGHGIVEIARIAKQNHVDVLAVANTDEGILLRKAGIEGDILILSPCIKQELEFLYQFNLTPLVTHLDYLSELNFLSKKYSIKLPIHIKINTGMNRVGFSIDDIEKSIKILLDSNSVVITGIATHFACSSDISSEAIAQTNKQMNLFKIAIDKIEDYLEKNIIIHAANTGAILNHEKSYFNMVRVGIGAYGYPLDNNINLKPILNLKTKIVYSQYIKKGEYVSYDSTWYASEDTFISLLPIGYGDGYPRSLSNKGFVRIGDEYYPIIGKICMDMMIINTKNKLIPLETDVLIMGNDPKLNAEMIASQIDTISYELITSIKDRVPRIYI